MAMNEHDGGAFADIIESERRRLHSAEPSVRASASSRGVAGTEPGCSSVTIHRPHPTWLRLGRPTAVCRSRHCVTYSPFAEMRIIEGVRDACQVWIWVSGLGDAADRRSPTRKLTVGRYQWTSMRVSSASGEADRNSSCSCSCHLAVPPSASALAVPSSNEGQQRSRCQWPLAMTPMTMPSSGLGASWARVASRSTSTMHA